MDIDTDTETLEERIAELTEAIERCRKISLAAKIVLGAGAVYLAAALVGVAPPLPSTIIAALAAILGGIVLLGSNASTWTQMNASLADCRAALEAAQTLDAIAELPGRPWLHVVGEERPTLH